MPTSHLSHLLTFSPAKGWDFCCEIVIFLPHALSEFLICFNRKQVRPFFMFQAHLFSYFGVQKCFVWKRFATMRSYDNMFHGFCSTRKCFQQRLISFRSVLSDTTQELLLLSIRLQNCSFYNHLLFDRTDSCLRSNWLLVSIETTFNWTDFLPNHLIIGFNITCYRSICLDLIRKQKHAKLQHMASFPLPPIMQDSK